MTWSFFDGWDGIARVLVVGTLAYAALVLVLRVTGKRTLSKMNAFDFIVTVALGSALASTILSKSTPLAEGIAGLTLLIVLQYAVTWISTRSDRFQDLVKAQPSLLVHQGRFLHDALRRERVTTEEVLAALRQNGKAALEPDTTVVLESDGSLSILGSAPAGGTVESSLSNVAPLADGGRHTAGPA